MEEERWVRRTRNLLDKLAASTTILNEQIAVKNILPNTDLFNRLHDALDSRIVFACSPFVSSIDYRSASRLIDCEQMNHDFALDLAHIYLPCLHNYHYLALDNHTYSSDQPNTSLESIESVIKSAFRSEELLPILRSLKDNDRAQFIEKLCYRLLQHSQIQHCRKMLYHLKDKYKNSLIHTLCEIKSCKYEHAILYMKENEQYFDKWTRILLESYCHILLSDTGSAIEILDSAIACRDSIDSRSNAYFSYFRALIYYDQGEWTQCISCCEDSIEEILSQFSETDSSRNVIRIQPLLLYAQALSNSYYFEQSEMVFHELTILFPKNAEGHYRYALFLKNFRNRDQDYMKQISTAIGCANASYVEWNEYLHSLIFDHKQPHSAISQLLNTLGTLEQTTTDALSTQFGLKFKDQALTESEFKSERSSLYFSNFQHEIHCSFIYFLCARIYGLQLKLQEKATILYERASQIERWCLRKLMTDPVYESTPLRFNYTLLFNARLEELVITKEMCQFLVHTNQKERLSNCKLKTSN